MKAIHQCLRKDMPGVREICRELLERGGLDYQDNCFLLFVFGEYVRITEDLRFLEEMRQRAEKLQAQVMEEWQKPHSSLSGEEADHYASNAGMAYGGLYNSNLYIKNEQITRMINGMKNYAYATYTDAGKLVSVKGKKEVKADLLWVCVPFGLFNPEDLVLVEAVKEMTGQLSAYENALLGWYFAEKADYPRAKMHLEKAGDDEAATAVKEIIREKLMQAGAIKESPVIHVPYGNFNRYQPRNYERCPWNPKDGEEVTVFAATWPIRYDEPVYVLAETDGGQRKEIQGIYREETGNYSFALGAFQGGTRISYSFRAGDFRSETYEFRVLKKESIKDIEILDIKEDRIALLLTSVSGNGYLGELRNEGGRMDFGIRDAVEKAEVSHVYQEKDCKIKALPDGNGGMAIEKDGFRINIENIYFWIEDQTVFSTGIKIASGEEEGFYGFGERYNHINQRGNLVDVYVYNQYKDQGIKTYIPMPYFLSSDGYGIHLPTNCYTTFDLCRSFEKSYVIETQMQNFEMNCFIGTPKEVIGQFTALTGKPEMIPEWAFGPWMSSNNWDSEAEVRKQVELTKQHDIPSTVLVIEAWSDEATYYIFNDAVYKENDGGNAFGYEDFHFPEWGRWPDPKGMVSYLHENGLKCILWQIPIIKYINSLHHLQKDKDEAYATEHGYCVKKKDGTPYRMPEGWFTNSLLFDYTSEEASKWWFDKRDYLVSDIKVDGFKTDGGEFVFGDELQFSDGTTGKEMRNEYPNLYISKYYEYIREARKGMVFSRAGFTGAAKSPAHWAGDEKSTFSAFKRNLCAGINAGISGVPFWGWDLAGFSGEIPGAELFVRSTAMAAFCPIMQYHAESKAEFNQDRTPWNIAERRNAPWVIEDYRYFAKLRMAMIPYIMEQAEISAETGIPLMRAMIIEFPEDRKCRDIFDQYLFGSDLLVAPVVEEGKMERTVYVPEGMWINIFNNKEYVGNREYTMESDVHEIIVLQRADSKWHFETDKEKMKVYKREK